MTVSRNALFFQLRHFCNLLDALIKKKEDAIKTNILLQ